MPVGKTKDSGWQIGVSRTLDHPIDTVWALLASQRGLAIWLGEGVRLEGRPGETYTTSDGTTGDIRSFHPRNRIRITWQPVDWDHDSTVQVAVSAAGERTRMTLHQERLADADERERQRAHWKRVADQLADELATT